MTKRLSVEKVDNTIHWINLFLVNKAINFPNTSPLDVIYAVDSAIQRLKKTGVSFNLGWVQSPNDVIQKITQISDGQWKEKSHLSA